MTRPGYWLVKTEPKAYGFTRLERETETVWDRVKNPYALKHLRSIKLGDQVLVYHTGKEKAIVGIAEAASDPYPDPRSKNPRMTVIKLRARRELPKPVPLKEIRSMKEFRGFPLVRQPRLSVMPILPLQWDVILRLAEGRDQTI